MAEVMESLGDIRKLQCLRVFLDFGQTNFF